MIRISKILNPSSVRSPGFTIVELLIVIVLIGILAAISIVAYNGIQDRVRLTSIKTDVSNFGRTVEAYKAEYGRYPTGGSWINSGVGRFTLSDRSHYMQRPETLSNFTVCFSRSGETIGLVLLTTKNEAYSAYSADGFKFKPFSIEEWVPNSTTSHERCQSLSSELSLTSPSTGNHQNYNGYRDITGSDEEPWRIWVDGE